MSAFLSGEMKDTVQMHPVGAYGLYLLIAIVFYLNSCASSSRAFLFS